MQIRVNDEPRDVDDNQPLSEVVKELGLAETRGVAIAINGEVVPRATWTSRSLCEGDRVLVIRATQGG